MPSDPVRQAGAKTGGLSRERQLNRVQSGRERAWEFSLLSLEYNPRETGDSAALFSMDLQGAEWDYQNLLTRSWY
jgi:hypothetical protein